MILVFVYSVCSRSGGLGYETLTLASIINLTCHVSIRTWTPLLSCLDLQIKLEMINNPAISANYYCEGINFFFLPRISICPKSGWSPMLRIRAVPIYM